jgi:Rieske Fe-S protein
MDRRSFMKWATHGLGVLLGVVLGGTGVAYLLDPRNRKAATGDFKRVGLLSELKRGGKPMEAVVRETRRDAWTLHPDDLVGRVWLVLKGDNEVDAFTTVCPHLGCSVNFEDKRGLFVCPCHNGTFEAAGPKVGERVEDSRLAGAQNPAPRGMDRLEVRLVPEPGTKDYSIEVKYQKFEQGKDRQIPKA